MRQVPSIQEQRLKLLIRSLEPLFSQSLVWMENYHQQQTIMFIHGNFNRFGSPAEISDNAGHVSTFSHYDDGARRHKLRQSSLTGKLVTNLLKNTGFDAMGEFEDGWGNASGLTEASAWGVERVTDKGYFADTSIRVTKTQKNSFAAVIQEVWLEAGTYTLSAYTFVKDVAAVSNNAQAGAGLAVRFADQSMAYGLEFLTGNTDTDIDGGWKRVSQTFTVSSAQVVTIYGGIFNTTGTAWFDCFQLETGDRMSDFNMVNNGRFARNSTNGVNDWNHVNLVASDTTVTDSERGSCLRITGEPDKEKRVLQGIYAKGGEGDVFRFGCFAKAEAIPGKTFRIAAAVIYADGTHKWENVDFDPYRSGWQYVSGVVSTDDEDSVTNKQYTAVHLYIMYDNQMNPGYFTDVQFMKDDSWSYTYDSKGNLNTAKKTRENNAFQHNSKDQISRMAAMDALPMIFITMRRECRCMQRVPRVREAIFGTTKRDSRQLCPLRQIKIQPQLQWEECTIFASSVPENI